MNIFRPRLIKTLTFVALLNGCFNTDAQPVRPGIIAICDSIAEHNVVESRAIGVGGVLSPQWQRFQRLSVSASDAELTLLSGHKNAVVRCYAFQALADRTNVAFMPVLKKHLRDSTEVQTLMGCIMRSESAGDYMLQTVYPDRLTRAQIGEIDSILLFDPVIRLDAKTNLLLHLKPKKQFYPRIREIAIRENRPEAFVALSRFRNSKDVPLIQTLFRKESTEYYAIYAAREFPDKAFYPQLLAVFDREWIKTKYDYPKWRILYQALARYPNSTTLARFKKTVETKDPFRYQTLGKYLLMAITRYPDKMFEPLKSKIKLEGGYRDLEWKLED